ncbi:hypothetical protein [Puia sp.]|jgi:hypothetical protein|uniref:hypothetical protein n=1 Tax=Puia sp. TaxID=2045100 RepID=UPI002F41B2D9
MIYAIQGYLIVYVLFLAGKDADSYQLKDRQDNPLSSGRVKRWHRDGLALFVLYVGMLMYYEQPLWWKTGLVAILIRLAIFDIFFNRWSSLEITYLGGTAGMDRLFVSIFGINGAVRKSLFFAAILVALNLLNIFLWHDRI